jgi:hypothetical protein
MELMLIFFSHVSLRVACIEAPITWFLILAVFIQDASAVEMVLLATFLCVTMSIQVPTIAYVLHASQDYRLVGLWISMSTFAGCGFREWWKLPR